MKFVLAFDKFKGCLTALEACEVAQAALLGIYPDARIILKPMADGGDGTAATLQTVIGGEWVARQVMGPLPGTTTTARYLWIAEKRMAVVEMAQASGLALLPPNALAPLRTTTYGTGELIVDAIGRGARRIWLTVGGSATIDGGVGAAMALGWRFLDARGEPIRFGGGELERIDRIEPPQRAWPPVEVLCDVDNPLCGEHGAARVFGPQKGAAPVMVDRLDAGLRHLAAMVRARLGTDIINVPGAGAAGGLAGGAIAFLNASLVRGAETVMGASGLAAELTDADWVITGEGQFDEQSLRGKVVAGVTAQAKQTGAKVALFAGRVRLTEAAWRQAGVDVACAITPPDLDTEEATARARRLLLTAVRRQFAAH